MTKEEFIQEAALRLISVGASSGSFFGMTPFIGEGQTIGQLVSCTAAEIADEVWKLFEDKKQKENKQ